MLDPTTDLRETPREAASPSRVACATAIRRLGHGVVGHVVDDVLLDRIAGFVEEILPTIEQGPPRGRPADDMKRRMFETAPEDGQSLEHYPDCIVSGPANPMGIALTCRREGVEGAPGRAHGGVVAAVFDDVMGFVLSMVQTPAYTGRLTVSYLAPTPLATPLEFRAHVRSREGRKLWIAGEARVGGERFAEAEGLFISIPIERFGGAT